MICECHRLRCSDRIFENKETITAWQAIIQNIFCVQYNIILLFMISVVLFTSLQWRNLEKINFSPIKGKTRKQIRSSSEFYRIQISVIEFTIMFKFYWNFGCPDWKLPYIRRVHTYTASFIFWLIQLTGAQCQDIGSSFLAMVFVSESAL